MRRTMQDKSRRKRARLMRSAARAQETDKPKESSQQIKPKKIKTRPKGKKQDVLQEPLQPILTEEEKRELAKTEAEMGIEKDKFICVVHKGPIKGDNIYLCPTCETFYCRNCAKVLKDKGEHCWNCEHEFEL